MHVLLEVLSIWALFHGLMKDISGQVPQAGATLLTGPLGEDSCQLASANVWQAFPHQGLEELQQSGGWLHRHTL